MPGLERRYGDDGRAGERGEVMFERGLANTEISDFYAVAHSVGIPTPPGRKPMDGDVDFIIMNGKNILNIDVKNWSVNEPLWTDNDGVFMRGNTHESKRLSRNMEIAQERWSLALRGAAVSSMVVFVPSNGAAEKIIDVNRLRWPGDIQSYTAAQSFTEILRRLGRPRPVDPEITKMIADMQIATPNSIAGAE